MINTKETKKDFLELLLNKKLKKILDLGCGKGLISKFFERENVKIIGIDIKKSSEDSEHFKFIEGDIRKKDFEEENPNFWKKYEQEFWKNYEGRVNGSEGFKKSEGKKKSGPEINFSVNVDPSLCIACCSCETIAPGVFIVDRLTKMNPKSRVHNERGDSFNKVMNAAETCPTHAINVDDKDLKKRIYPW